MASGPFFCWWLFPSLLEFSFGLFGFGSEKIQGALADSRAQVAREFPFVVDRLFPEAGVAEPRMPLYWFGYSGLDARRLYHYGDGCAQGIF